MTIQTPKLSLVLLIGPSGSGKSTFGRRHFLPTEVVSSDTCRGLVCDDENSLPATGDAFELLHFMVRKRLERGHLTVVDATNVQEASRRALVQIAREFHTPVTGIVFLMPEEVCQERNRLRPDRQFGPHVVRNHLRDLRRGLRGLEREGVRNVTVLRSPEEVDAATVTRVPLWTDRRDEHGPFDIVGDVHGCFDELHELLTSLGYGVDRLEDGSFVLTPPEGRKLVLLGDLVDRGPYSPDVLRLAMDAVEAGVALCVPGNHDVKLLRKLSGRNVNVSHGLAETLAQLEKEPPEFLARVRRFLDGLVSHYVLDDGRLVVAHAGMKASMQGRASGRVREFALYGETTGETDEFGLPVRYNWAAEYRGDAAVVYGHTPVPRPEWINGTVNVDTGCVFGGALTALRYPEREFVSVPAHQTYAEPSRPFLIPDSGLSAQHALDDLLDLADVTGKRRIETRLQPAITVHEENATAALEAMSRFAANPKWLVYLPPTMSPTETSEAPGLLEHPAQAFGYYRHQGVGTVVCEEKHMGSRAVVAVCRDAEAAARAFGVDTGESGAVMTRTGRRFFDDRTVEAALLDHLVRAMDAAGLWERLETDWALIDAELMPWSAKAQELLRRQYAPVGSAATAATLAALEVATAGAERLPDVALLAERLRTRADDADRYVQAYRRYCWPVTSLEDLRLAPFHLLASEGQVHVGRDHVWHMETLGELCDAGAPILHRTPYRVVDLADEAAVASATEWWEGLTGAGGEGMVVKPLDFVVRGEKGLVQPAVKCRGREYLRIIYGPDYTEPENLERLRRRGLGRKRGLASREFALGVEALERFVRREPLRRVHECVFAILAMESEPVDPRL